MKKKLIVFTDLDGTLLNHGDYCWDAAKPALDLLLKNDCPVIINSSKTQAEIESLRKALNNNAPYIVENGSAVFIPRHYFNRDQGELTIKRFGPSHQFILQALHQLRKEFDFQFRGFSDMSLAELINHTGLDRASAEKAKQREASEPLVWCDSDRRFPEFVSMLAAKNLSIVVGGRFYHVMGAVSKADSIEWLMNSFRDLYPDVELISVGLGDSENDIPMLETVDEPVLIRGAHGKTISLERTDVCFTSCSGAAGWNEAMQKIVAKYF